MGTINANDLKKRTRILVDEQPWEVISSDFVKPGKGQAFTRSKIKNLLTDRVIERTYKSNTSIETVDVIFKKMQYLYNDQTNWSFMDPTTYEQIDVTKDLLGDHVKWFLDGIDCEIGFWDEKIISVVLPNFLVYTVTYTEPTVKGNTATNITKDATIETEAVVQVPLFIDNNMKIKIDTRTGRYVERVK